MENEFIENAKQYLMNNYAQLPLALVKGEGVTLFDSEGKSYIDFTSGIGVNSLGYGNEDFKAAVTEQVQNIVHSSNIFYNVPAVKLAQRLVQMSGMSNVFFANSGAEANEAAIKIARKYSFEKYGQGRSTIITLKQSFHGRTVTTLSATGQAKFHNYFFPFTEGFKFVEANNMEEFLSSIDSTVCAVMMEAIQGEGGVRPLDEKFVTDVVSICEDKDILVIFDEVQCGIGRTGKLYGFNHFNIKPDIISVAKGLGSGFPIGAAICNEKTSKVFKPGDHGSTFGGNAVSCAAGLVVLNKICSEGFLDEIQKKETLIRQYFSNNKCGNVVEIRGKGLMIGIEISGKSANVQIEAMKNGLLVLTAGEKVVRLLPPLIISEKQLTEGLEILLKAISEAGA